MLVLLGSDFRSSPLDFRERISPPAGGVQDALRRLVAEAVVDEAVILSTCNRVEVVMAVSASPDDARAAVEHALWCDRGVTREDLDRYCYLWTGRDAVRHLFRLASGLESMIIGEPQILGQVKEAYRLAKEVGTISQALDPLLQRGLAAAKRIRSETGIARNPVSVAYAAVQLARNIFGDLSGRKALLLGAGKMAGLVAKHLAAQGVDGMVFASRSYTRAVQMATRVDGQAVHWNEGLSRLKDVDIVVTCTAAPHRVLTSDIVAPVVHRRRGVPLFLIDIAVPRDIDPAVNRLDNVYLFDIDGLQSVVDSSLEERRAAAARADGLIADEVAAFDRWQQSRMVGPIVTALRERLTGIARSEISRMRGQFGELDVRQERAVEELTRSLIGKILHRPIRHLKAAAERGEADHVNELFRELFDIDVSDHAQPAAGSDERGAGRDDDGSTSSPSEADPKDPTMPLGLGPRRALKGGRE